MANAGPPSGDQVRLNELIAAASQLRREGRIREALGCLQEAVEHGAPAQVQGLFARMLAHVRFTGPRPDLKPLMIEALRQPWALPSEIMRSAVSLLLQQENFVERTKPHDTAELPDINCEAIVGLLSDPLLIEMLCASAISSFPLENLLVRLRRVLLESCRNNSIKAQAEPGVMKFAAALAWQCFLNDYAFFVEAEEASAIEQICGATDAIDLTPIQLCVLACYKPLHDFPFRDRLVETRWPPEVDAVIARQIREPLEEAEIARRLPRITPIRNAVSVAVKKQYEEAPYPRWNRVPRFPRNDLKAFLSTYGAVGTPKRILVAGCGTGQESVSFGIQFPESVILALDLSAASLAYAARKAGEYRLDNLRHVQADISELGELKSSFDLVVCAGVVHHMDNPFEALTTLVQMTVPGGHLLIALYSTLGRRDIDSLGVIARSGGYGSEPSELRRFRRDVVSLDPAHEARLSAEARDDFFSLNMLRDMVFHSHEVRFDIPAIGDHVRRLDVDFLSFSVTQETRQRFLSRFGEGANLQSFELWRTFEEENLATFSGMYHFLLRKRA